MASLLAWQHFHCILHKSWWCRCQLGSFHGHFSGLFTSLCVWISRQAFENLLKICVYTGCTNKNTSYSMVPDSLWSKRYDVMEWAMRVVYWINQKFKDCNSIDASPYKYPCITICIKICITICWCVYFVTGLNLVLQQPSTAVVAKAKADIAKKSSYCYSSCSLWASTTQYTQWMCLWEHSSCIIITQVGLFLSQKQLFWNWSDLWE